MFRQRSGRRGMLALCAALLVSGCGGGGSGGSAAPPPTFSVGGNITGLLDGTSVTLLMNSESRTFAGSGGGLVTFRFDAALREGATYRVSIGRHPLNQLCRVVDGSGTISRTVSNIDVFCHETRLNDTGVGTGLEGSTGRDAAAANGTLTRIGGGRLGFDFVRVCGSGEAAGEGSCPADPAAGNGADDWACTRDTVTGLLWQAFPDPTPVARDSAAAVADQAAADLLCGRDDWRLPQVIELLNLVDSSAAAGEPSIDTGFFPDTVQDAYWSGEERAGDPAVSWVVSFDSGAAGIPNQGDEARVRAVAGTSGSPGISVVDATIFVDERFDLMWLVTDASGDQAAAIAAADAVNAEATGGFDDWRLPNRNELAALIERAHKGPAVDAAIADRVDPAGHWSTTPFAVAEGVSGEFGWVVDFDSGDVLPRSTSDDRFILLMRNRIPGE